MYCYHFTCLNMSDTYNTSSFDNIKFTHSTKYISCNAITITARCAGVILYSLVPLGSSPPTGPPHNTHTDSTHPHTRWYFRQQRRPRIIIPMGAENQTCLVVGVVAGLAFVAVGIIGVAAGEELAVGVVAVGGLHLAVAVQALGDVAQVVEGVPGFALVGEVVAREEAGGPRSSPRWRSRWRSSRRGVGSRRR